jgi:hypothetical protein
MLEISMDRSNPAQRQINKNPVHVSFKVLLLLCQTVPPSFQNPSSNLKPPIKVPKRLLNAPPPAVADEELELELLRVGAEVIEPVELELEDELPPWLEVDETELVLLTVPV